MFLGRLPTPLVLNVLSVHTDMYNNSVYDSPEVDMLDFGDNTGCWDLFNEMGLDYEYEKVSYIYTDSDLF